MLTVHDIMSKHVHHVQPNDTLRHVHSLLKLTRTRHAPVLDNGILVGIVSDRDVHLGWSQGPDRTSVDAVMHRDPWWVGPETPALRAAEMMLEHKFGSLPVLDHDKRLVGIVTETDFLAIARRALQLEQSMAS